MQRGVDLEHTGAVYEEVDRGRRIFGVEIHQLQNNHSRKPIIDLPQTHTDTQDTQDTRTDIGTQTQRDTHKNHKKVKHFMHLLATVESHA
jgi:hypothetical protein